MSLASLILLLATPQSASKVGGFQFQGDRFTLPFETIHDYIFVEGKVNGLAGKFIFDTGYETSLRLNSNRIKNLGALTNDGVDSKSEKSFGVKAVKQVAKVSIGPTKGSQTSQNVTGAKCQNASFMERFSKDFLGWIGFDYFSSGIIKLDFRAKQITLYRNTAKRSQEKDFLKGEQIIAAIPFEIRKLSGMPIVPVKIGSQSFGGAFTTGQKGTLFMSTESRQELLDDHSLTQTSKKEDSGMGDLFSVRVEKMTIGSFLVPGRIEGLDSFDQPDKAKEAIGIDEPNLIYLGTAFLSQYKTVWDFPAKKIYLLKR